MTVKGFDGKVHYFTFTATSSIAKGNYSYNTLNSGNLSINDRIAITQKGSGDVNISVLSERTGTVGVSGDKYIYLVNTSTAVSDQLLKLRHATHTEPTAAPR